MLKALLAAILVALVVVILLLLPIFRPERGTGSVNTASAPPPSSVVIHNDAPPPEPPAAPAIPAPDSLDAVIQRLRSAKPDATVLVTPAAPAAAVPTPAPAPALPLVVPVPPPPAEVPPPAPPRWTNVSGQGVQYRLGRAGDGYVISIDLGGGQVAEVHVLAAFGRLDQKAVDVRVDYLKQTILENFSSVSASYSFNRDGSVTRGR